MAEKYGRLFTEQDVLAIARPFMAHAFYGREPNDERQREVFYEGHLRNVVELLDVAFELTFPADEPLFLLRAQDQCAPDAIADGPICYEDECSLAGASEAHLEEVRAAANRMRKWQAANPDRVKVPD